MNDNEGTGVGHERVAGEGPADGLVRPGRQLARASVIVGVMLLVVVVTSCAAWAATGPEGVAQVQRFASRLTNYVTAVAASVAVLFMAVNGIRYTVSNGNPSRQIEAKNGLLSAAVGLAVALSANVLVQLVVAALG